jgi:putative DNA primase/helicase
VSEKWSQLGAKLWSEAKPIAGTPAETYLVENRGIKLTPWPDSLRYHDGVVHPTLKQKFEALIAEVIGSSEPSYQFTFLAACGRGKARVGRRDQRRTLGSNLGGVVVLAEVQPGATIVCGEGLETVLAVMSAVNLPGVAVLGVSGLANVEFSVDVAEVLLLAENDENAASRKAIDKVCPALIEKGIKVRVAEPPAGFGDFNDVIKGDGVDRASGLTIVQMAISAALEWKPRRGATRPKEKAERGSQASFLVELAVARCELFCDPQDEPYAAFAVAHCEGETHRETHKIRSRGFNRWLRLLYFHERNGAPSSEAMSSASKTIEAKAHYDGVRHDVFLRSANLNDRVYVDMCNARWQAIVIDGDGWRVIDDPPPHFRREPGMLPLPTPSTVAPKHGIERLTEVLRLRDERDLVVVTAWALAALANRSPFTVIVFLGEPGSTKTSAAFVVRSLVDPNVSPLRARPKDLHEVFVAAAHSRVVAYNNLSHLPDWLSDGICVVSEGSGESQRELFTNADESLIVACAPFMVTSIENVIRRGDLAQRTLYVHLASVSDKERMTEDEFKLKFRRAHADILGALCSAVAHGLKTEKALKIGALPRMATFYKWTTACEGALWPKGTFAAAFEANALGATEDVIESDKAAFQLRLFMIDRGEWNGTATQLLVELAAYVRRPVREAEAAYAKATDAGKYADRADVEKAAADLREAREKARDTLGEGWPKASNALSGKLKRASPALRKAGIVIEWPTRHDGPKAIKITFVANQRESRVDRPEPTKRPPKEATSNHFNCLDKDQAADPSSSRTITGEVPDDLDPVPSDHGPDDPESSRTIPGRSWPQPSSGSSAVETKGNSSGKDHAGNPDDSCGPFSNSGPTYPDEPAQGDGDDDDDWRDGGSGIL